MRQELSLSQITSPVPVTLGFKTNKNLATFIHLIVIIGKRKKYILNYILLFFISPPTINKEQRNQTP